jgi:hypothetical protein
MRRTSAIVAVVAVSAVAGSVIVASAAGPAGVDACYKTSTGALRVDIGGGCKPAESPLTLGTGGVQTRWVHATVTSPEGSWLTAEAMCDRGEVVTGGGFTAESIGDTYVVHVNGPAEVDGREGWFVSLHHFDDPATDYPFDFTATAVCAPAAPDG